MRYVNTFKNIIFLTWINILINIYFFRKKLQKKLSLLQILILLLQKLSKKNQFKKLRLMTKKKSKLQSKIKKKLRKNRLFHLTQVMMIHLQKRNHKKKIFLQRDQELHQMLVVKVIPAAQKLKKQMKRKLFQQKIKKL